MVKRRSIAVIVPAYCEERLIERTLTGLPDLVGRIIVVDDASPDETSTRARSVSDSRITVIRHQTNRGVGAAIYSGYQEALRHPECEILVVMAGDNQMDPADLAPLTEPIFTHEADYVKGNRLVHPQALEMPRIRRFGTRVLAKATSIACGQKLGDSQCGYTAISREAALAIDWSGLWPRYGYPNDVLLALASRGFRIAERPVRPIYRDETSGLRFWHFFSILGLIARRALQNRNLLRSRPLLTASHRADENRAHPARPPLATENP